MRSLDAARRRFLHSGPSASPSAASHPQSTSGPAVDTLRERLDHWSHLWSAESAAAGTDAHRVVSARLNGWLERCFGRHIVGRQAPVSLASSTPIFTAFLGRRATRELSRRVLRDM